LGLEKLFFLEWSWDRHGFVLLLRGFAALTSCQRTSPVFRKKTTGIVPVLQNQMIAFDKGSQQKQSMGRKQKFDSIRLLTI